MENAGTNSTSFEEGLRAFLQGAVEKVHGQRGLVMVPIENSQDMEVKAAFGLDPDTVWTTGQISQTILRRVAGEKQPLLTHNAMQDPRFSDTTSVVISGLRSVICVPILVDGNVWGVLYVDNPIQAGAFKAANLNELKEYTGRLSDLIKSVS
ncbi:MAG: GAF domain-containing protein [Candidatus Xenobia bacterium]